VGVSFFINSPGTGSGNNIVFSKNKTVSSIKPDSEYSFVFGSGTIDLTKAHPQKAGDKIKINNVFSNGVIKVNPQTPLVIRTHSLFAVTETPNNDLIFMGNTNYQSKNFKKDAKHIEVEAKVIFGKLAIEEDTKPSSIKK
jgi:predicted membrane protein